MTFADGSTAQLTTPEFVPVPERAAQAPIPATGYARQDLGGGMYGLRDGVYASMFLVTRTGVVVIDAPPTMEHTLRSAIGEVTDLPVTHVVYSHSHLDHIGAAHLFADTARYVAHELTADLLNRADDPRRPLPTETFAGAQMVLEVGGERLVLDYRGNNHQAGNLFIHAPAQRVLMLVDVIAPRWTPFFRLDTTPNVRAHGDATAQVLSYDFDTFVGGHVGFGTPADVEEHGRYLADLHAATSEAFRTTDFAEAARGAPADNVYAQFKLYIDKLVDRSVELMPDSWLTRLGGADVFLRDNASAMIVSHALD